MSISGLKRVVLGLNFKANKNPKGVLLSFNSIYARCGKKKAWYFWAPCSRLKKKGQIMNGYVVRL